jgi:hypothetical protein
MLEYIELKTLDEKVKSSINPLQYNCSKNGLSTTKGILNSNKGTVIMCKFEINIENGMNPIATDRTRK